MEALRVFIGLGFLAVGLPLFIGAAIVRFRMEKEVKSGRVVFWNNFLPYWNSKDFTEEGNLLRRMYNKLYFVAIIYSLAFLVFMKSDG